MDSVIQEMAMRALYVAVIISLVPVGTATVTGFIVATFQTLSQVQEQTLPFFFKMIATFGVMYVASSWASKAILEFSLAIFQAI